MASSASRSVDPDHVHSLLERRGEMNLSEIAGEFEVNEEDVRDALRRLSDDHRIVWGSDFTYRVVDK